MKHVPETGKEFKEAALMSLEYAAHWIRQGFPDIARGHAETALDYIKKWREVT